MSDFECFACGADSYKQELYEDAFSHCGREIHVRDLEANRCNSCGELNISAAQLKSNQKKIADEKRSSDGLFTGEQIRAISKSLDLSQQDAARIFGGGQNCFSKYERGEVIQSEPMNNLLFLAARDSSLLELLRNRKYTRRIELEMSAHVVISNPWEDLISAKQMYPTVTEENVRIFTHGSYYDPGSLGVDTTDMLGEQWNDEESVRECA